MFQITFVEYLNYFNICYCFHYVTVNHTCNNFLKIAARKRLNHLDIELAQLQVSHAFKHYKTTDNNKFSSFQILRRMRIINFRFHWLKEHNCIYLQGINISISQTQRFYYCFLSYVHSSTTYFGLTWPSSGVVTLTKIGRNNVNCKSEIPEECSWLRKEWPNKN